jgi:mannose-6-phosphate isomerase-like protein (cupin superfamily)
MIPIGTAIDSPQTGERLIFRSTEDSSGGKLFQAELIVQATPYVVRSHVHPNQEERFVVLEGRYGWRIGDKSGVSGPGETLVCPKGCPHSQWNAGTSPMRIYYEHRPALTSAEIFFETQFGLSREGKLAPNGDISLLQAAVLISDVGDFIRPAEPARWIQDIVFPPLGALGKLLGYRSRYARYERDWNSGDESK